MLQFVSAAKRIEEEDILVDPYNMTVEVYRLGSGAFDPVGCLRGENKARPEPFIEIEIDLGSLWLDG